MNISDKPKENCCGCSACVAICPKNAIKMKKDTQGFLYPYVEKSKCVDCGLCTSVCKEKEIDNHSINAYAAKSADGNVQCMASSGGVAFELAKEVIEKGGVVYGVIYDKKHQVCYYRADDLNACRLFLGSKYVQSNPLDSFDLVRKDLLAGKTVLFIGTSCYVAKLKTYLMNVKCKENNLITCDLICHGVASPGLFEDYISFLKKDSKFEHFEFRTKKKPWGYGSKNYGCTIYKKNGVQLTDTLKARLFLNLFFSNNCIRPYCYTCPYAGCNKPADITIADYWGLLQEHPDFFDEKGVNAVLTHSEKGDKLFKSCRLIWIESSVEKIAYRQKNMQKSSKKSKNYDDFWKLYEKYGFKAVAKKYGSYNIKGRIVYSKLYEVYKKVMKNLYSEGTLNDQK